MNLHSIRDALAATARQTQDHNDLLSVRYKAIFATGFAGAAADALAQGLDAATAELIPPAVQMRAVAGIIAELAAFEQRLEALRLTGPITEMVASLESLGRAVDWMCARSIDVLCTPASTPPPRYLEDFGDLDLAAISEINTLTSPPEIAELVRANPDVYVLESGEGHFVALVDPDVATTAPATVTTFVPGVGSSNTAEWQRAVERSRAMAVATGGPVALWLGYTAPKSVAHGLARNPAQHAATDLVRFQRSMQERFPHAHTTVVGYSYGSVVTGHAAKAGLVADDVVFVGSPGVGAKNVDELGFPGRVHAVTADGDIIALTAHGYGGIHGPDPTSPQFGARPWPTQPKGDHSSYWESPEFLRALAALQQGQS